MKKLLFCLAIFSSSVLFGQVTDIRGIVSDSTTGERVPYANVILIDLSKGASTNQNGFYIIPNVPEGTYEIAASAVGYARQVKRVTVRGKEAIVVNYRITQQDVKMQEVVVTGQQRRELTEIYTSAHVLEKSDMKLVPVTGQEDVFRSIQILPGIVSTSDVNSQFYVRGGAGDQNLILLDGMKVYNPFHAFGLFSVFDPDVLKSAEVYTGAFPSDYGGRLSSVVSILTRDGSNARLAGRANINFLSSKVQLEGPIAENIQIIATGRRSVFQNTFKQFLKENAPLSFYDALAKITLKDSESQDRFSAQAFLSGDVLLASKPDEPEYSWTNRAFAIELNKLFQDRLYVNAVLSGGEFSQVRDPKGSELVSPASTSVREFSLRANATAYTSEKDLYVFGFEFNFPSLEYSFLNRVNAATKLTSGTPDVSSWLRYQMQRGIIQASVGLRAELGSLLRGRGLNAGLQPRVNLSVDLGSSWRGKIAYGRFSQEVVTVNNEDDVIPIFNAWITIPDNLEPEQADHYVAGIEGNIFPALSTNLQGFYKNYRSLISYNRDKIDASDPDYVNAKGEAYGGEALVRFTHPIIDVYGTYSLTFVKINQNGFVYPPRYDRRHSINLLTTLHLISNLDFTLRWEFGSGLPFTQSIGFYDKLTLGNGYPNPFLTETGQPRSLLGPKNAARLPSYHRLDVTLAYRVHLFSSTYAAVGLNIINAYDQKNVFYFDRITGQQINMLGFFPSATVTLEF